MLPLAIFICAYALMVRCAALCSTAGRGACFRLGVVLGCCQGGVRMCGDGIEGTCKSAFGEMRYLIARLGGRERVRRMP